MSIFDFIYAALPIVFLAVSVIIAIKMVEKGHSRKKSLIMQISSFASIFAICLLCPVVASAATGDAATAASSASDGMAFIGAAIATGLSCIGGGIAVGNGAPAAIGATSEDPKAFSKALIFVALGESIALYGLIISILIISKVG